MKDEKGSDAGTRYIGIFFLWAIPCVLGMAASVWLGVVIATHGYINGLTQEQRRAVYVGANVRPKDPLKIKDMGRGGCFLITRGDIDGESLTVYTKNACHEELKFPEWHWAAVSPDGTVIKSGYTNSAFCPGPIAAGEKSECVMAVKVDDRTETLQVWVNQ